MKNEKSTWVFIFQKYGKFWSILLGHFIKHKPLISEEWYSGELKSFESCTDHSKVHTLFIALFFPILAHYGATQS